MKHLIRLTGLLTLVLLFPSLNADAQGYYKKQTEFVKSRGEYRKEAKKSNKDLIDKDIKKAAKEKIKDGWQVNGGNSSLEYQLQMRKQVNDDRDPETNILMYTTGSGSGRAATREDATIDAELMAQRNLAQKLETQLSSLLKAGSTGKGIKHTMAAETLIQQNIKRSECVYNVYRLLPDGTYEVEQEWALNNIYLDQEAEKESVKAQKEEIDELQNELHERISSN